MLPKSPICYSSNVEDEQFNTYYTTARLKRSRESSSSDDDEVHESAIDVRLKAQSATKSTSRQCRSVSEPPPRIRRLLEDENENENEDEESQAPVKKRRKIG